MPKKKATAAAFFFGIPIPSSSEQRGGDPVIF